MIKRLAFLAFVTLLPVAQGFAAPNASFGDDDAMERAAEKLIKEGQEPKREKSGDRASTAPAKPESEDDVPVVMAEPAKAKSGGSLIWRLLVSIVVLAAAGVGLHFAARRYARGKDVGGAQSRIEMIHQFHLGPRKSLGLVRVAGEVMLVGITDHNINMIKTITMIDDDMAAAINQDFNGFLEDEFAVTDVNHIGRRNQ